MGSTLLKKQYFLVGEWVMLITTKSSSYVVVEEAPGRFRVERVASKNGRPGKIYYGDSITLAEGKRMLLTCQGENVLRASEVIRIGRR